MTVELIRRRLLVLADEGSARFAASLIPGLGPARILECCDLALRAFAKKLRKTEPEVVEAFLAELPHEFYDEDMLHAFLLGLETKPDFVFAKAQRFLPHAKNWAVYDALSPKGFTKDLGRLEAEVKRWFVSEHTYARRFGICMYTTHFLGEASRPEFLALIGSLDSEERHVYMAQGWYLATVPVKQPETTLPWLAEDRLPTLVHRKAIQKSTESFRAPDETKTVLRRVRESPPRRGVGS